ncbi:hypothetical protein HK405_001836 [Cladochytrium tenue]|nr:hypothetical protein HK405_001836 [Cladochytrium tenue]
MPDQATPDTPAAAAGFVPAIGVVLDQDGVLLKGHTAVPQAAAALARLDAARVPFVVLTNGGGRPEEAFAHRLADRIGRPFDPARIVLAHS